MTSRYKCTYTLIHHISLKKSDSMPKYECPRCLFQSIFLNDYRRHLDRISPCEDLCNSGLSINEIKNAVKLSKNENQTTCNVCGIVFSNKHQKCYHLKHSKCSKSTGAAPQHVTINITNNINTNADKSETKKGWLYAVTCPLYLLKGYVKLGKTRVGQEDRDAVIRGLKSRYVTTLIEPSVLAVMRTNDVDESEKALFEELVANRLTSNREIFVFDCSGCSDVEEQSKTVMSTVILPAMEKSCR